MRERTKPERIQSAPDPASIHVHLTRGGRGVLAQRGSMTYVDRNAGARGILIQRQTEPMELDPPFPYWGRKSAAVETVWRGLGRVNTYIEPFYGSGAVHLGSPYGPAGREIINDANSFCANFQRAMRADPSQVARHGDRPTAQDDLTAAKEVLKACNPYLSEYVRSDILYYDVEIAGLWAWYLCASIDIGASLGEFITHPTQFVPPHLPDTPPPIEPSEPLPPYDGVPFQGHRLEPWFKRLSQRLERCYILNKDWSTLFSPSLTGTTKSDGNRKVTGIFFDPPYATSVRTANLYQLDSDTVALDVRKWCVANGDNPAFRICLAGYSQDYPDFPDGWTSQEWSKAHGGMEYAGGATFDEVDQSLRQETLWFSPHCLNSGQGRVQGELI